MTRRTLRVLILCWTSSLLLTLLGSPVIAFRSSASRFSARTTSRTSTTTRRTHASSHPPPPPPGSHETLVPLHRRHRQTRHEQRKKEWIDRSVHYYSKVTREERRRGLGQAPSVPVPPEYQQHFVHLAKKHYFALTKIRNGNFHHAEGIYRRIIEDLTNAEVNNNNNNNITEEHHCTHAQLAVTTLLLALLLQRRGDNKRTRSVFLNFFRMTVLEQQQQQQQQQHSNECACSAKVLQAFALFEMKQGNPKKALELVQRAVQLDSSLAPVLQWKQFRDVRERLSVSNSSPLRP